MMPRELTRLDIATLSISAIMMSVAIWVATQAPQIAYALHFDAHGQPTRWGNRGDVALIMAAMGMACALVGGGFGLAAGHASDGPQARTMRYGQFVCLVCTGGVGLVIAILILGPALGFGNASQGAALPLTGLILVLVGAGLGRVSPNPFVGVRTPWVFKSRLAWERSNRLAGRLLFWIGLGTLGTSLFVPTTTATAWMLTSVLIAAAWSAFESWRVWRADPDRQPF